MLETLREMYSITFVEICKRVRCRGVVNEEIEQMDQWASRVLQPPLTMTRVCAGQARQTPFSLERVYLVRLP